MTAQYFRTLINRISLNESEDTGDSIRVSIPLLIRLMEWAREDVKDDKPLHIMVEELYAASDNGEKTLTTTNFSNDQL